MTKREIRFYKHYFNEFYVAQSEKVRRKIAQTLVWLQTLDPYPLLYSKVSKERRDFMKSGLNLEVIYSEFSVALIRGL